MGNNAIVTLLKELIMEYDRVSLPCLGSFLSEYSPAAISDGKICPPSKSIVFHQNEIWNDEKLENRIAQVNNISLGMAKEELAFWIDNICVLLATGEEVSLSGLGRLYVSKQAKLMFEQESENLLLDSFGLEPVDIQVPELTETEFDEFIAHSKNRKKQSETNGWLIGVLIIALLAAVAVFAVFKYILTGDKYLLPPPAIPVKTPAVELKYEEYFTPKYGIVLSSFEKLGEARDFSKQIPGTSIYCIDNETPYSVIFSYPSAENSNSALDSLKTIYSNAYIIELSAIR
jgi:hypothetical protein